MINKRIAQSQNSMSYLRHLEKTKRARILPESIKPNSKEVITRFELGKTVGQVYTELTRTTPNLRADLVYNKLLEVQYGNLARLEKEEQSNIEREWEIVGKYPPHKKESEQSNRNRCRSSKSGMLRFWRASAKNRMHDDETRRIGKQISECQSNGGDGFEKYNQLRPRTADPNRLLANNTDFQVEPEVEAKRRENAMKIAKRKYFKKDKNGKGFLYDYKQRVFDNEIESKRMLKLQRSIERKKRKEIMSKATKNIANLFVKIDQQCKSSSERGLETRQIVANQIALEESLFDAYIKDMYCDFKIEEECHLIFEQLKGKNTALDKQFILTGDGTLSLPSEIVAVGGFQLTIYDIQKAKKVTLDLALENGWFKIVGNVMFSTLAKVIHRFAELAQSKTAVLCVLNFTSKSVQGPISRVCIRYVNVGSPFIFSKDDILDYISSDIIYISRMVSENRIGFQKADIYSLKNRDPIFQSLISLVPPLVYM